jgi:hypothetical protein
MPETHNPEIEIGQTWENDDDRFMVVGRLRNRNGYVVSRGGSEIGQVLTADFARYRLAPGPPTFER